MAIVRAYLLPHPPLAVPEVGKGQERGIPDTLAAFDAVAREIADLAPDVIVYITPHGVMYADYFHISPGKGAKGNLGRFGAPETRFEAHYDEAFAAELARFAEVDGIEAGPLGEQDAALDHGTTVPMFFINRRYNDYRTVRVSQSGMDASTHYRLGKCIAKAVEAQNRTAVLIASGDLSHKLSADGPYGFAPEGAEFDGIVVEAMGSGDFLSLFTIPEIVRVHAAECGYNSVMVLAGAFDRVSVDAKLLSYEGPFGVGYAVASVTPGEPNERRNFAERFEALALAKASELRAGEDAYRALARKALEHRIETGKALPIPAGLPDEMLKTRAGTFVSLHLNGRLRGCIGTIMPTTANVALEIMQNAVSAGLHDSRFDPVTAAELPLLTYKVDVLSAPELISGPEELDVKRYGVIVSSDSKRGLLLPNLDGVDTVDEQIEIAREKGGIAINAVVTLERFEVVRHE